MSALAVLDRPTPLAVLGTVAAIDDPAAAADAALATGFVEWRRSGDVDTVAFTHPLFRAAVYDELAPPMRRTLHRAAVAVVDRRRALAHRVAATDHVDDDLAQELEAAVGEARRTDGPVAAARLLRWAANLSGDRGDHERRLLAAAHLLLVADDVAALAQLRPEIDACEVSAHKDLVLGQLAWQAGDVGEAERRLLAASRSTDTTLAVEALARLSGQYTIQARGPEAIEVATRALTMGITDPRLERQVWANRAVGLGQRDGAPAGYAAILERLPDPARRTAAIDVPLLTNRGILAFYAGRAHQAIEDHDEVTHRLRAHALPEGLRRAHVLLAQSLFIVGRWDDAVVNGHLALELSDDDHAWQRAIAHQPLAAVHAARGEWAAATAHADAAAIAAASYDVPENAIAARLAAVAIHQARGDSAAIVALFPSARPPTPMMSVLWWAHPLSAALIDTGDLEAAADAIDRFEQDGARRGLGVAMRVADLRARHAAATGDASAAASWFERAVEAISVDDAVLDVAGLRHAYGRLLRGQGRRQLAVDQLRQARDALAALGATPYVERIDAELADAGLSRPDKRGGRSPLELTAREQDVVTLALRGLTNREIAADLYVSQKAVEYHLRNVYGKLGITSRRELRDRLGPVPA